MKYIVPIIAMVFFSVFMTMAYAQTTSCYDNRILHIIEVDGLIQCLDTRISAIENQNATDSTTASNLGSIGEGIFSSEIGNDLQFKKLVNGTGITLNANGTRIMINSTASGSGEANTASNIGTSGQGVFSSKVGVDLQFKKIHTPLSCLTITSNSTNVNINNAHICGVVAGQTYFSQVKTNIGTTLVDVYTSAFDQENLMFIDFTGYTEAQIIFIWDYVGSGVHTLQWIHASGGGEALYSTNTVTSDEDGSATDWFPLPSSYNTSTVIEWQASSTVAGDDPIAKGYKIMLR